ncbi:MAG: 4-oxalocrotonate tautomerase [Treponema sp. GWB1_62_6]|nr:MAG: 4-oxalocrotonate tautomerase [Treponema sp. GWA1_62_8]OHE65193.1 MAG: 4-oxalocrotonate tautomerase [Treponema sp. GWC1_61_84]OHE69980.1 MAG: 4-oxalocrotonate tautomerase [Treponema sp. GWB1_62_6]OHE77127.1 MAG: 4-oxalocrotonate tautomerase [Treponema sp. RIFOXYC1_FULL_61_9]HCM25803.1 4-oxalocrotonate tautomerase [Treponema sp.]
MPVITIDMHKTGTAEKTALIRNLTAAAADATKIPPQSFIVLINEMDDVNIGLGGVPLDEVKRNRK